MSLIERLKKLIDKYDYNIGIYANDLKETEIKINKNKVFEAVSCGAKIHKLIFNEFMKNKGSFVKVKKK